MQLLHNFEKYRVLPSLIRLNFIATFFHRTVENANITWICITAFGGRIRSYFPILLTRAFKYAPANVITPFAFTGVIFPASVTGYSGITYQA